MKKLLLAAFLTLGALGLTVPATATPPQDTGHKVTICHRTNSDTNPYVVIEVDIASAGYGDGKGDHADEHQGPVWNDTLKEQHIKWGDIIPPYTYGDFSFPGLNATAEGQAIYENGCKPATPPPPPPDCEDDGSCPEPPPPTDPPKPPNNPDPPKDYPHDNLAETGFTAGTAATIAGVLAAIGGAALWYSRKLRVR